MKKGEKISDKVVAAMTKDFDADGDIIIGDEDELIMLRSGSPSDKEYTITIEKVSADPDDEDNKNYDILDQFSMENKDKKTISNYLYRQLCYHFEGFDHLKSFKVARDVLNSV